MQLLLGGAELGVLLFEHGQEQAFLAAVVVIEHPLVGLGPAGDLVDARAGQPALCEFFGGGGQDAPARAFGIPLGFWLV
ncbi:hypothetical protein D3C86_1447140 [compost metagenome]